MKSLFLILVASAATFVQAIPPLKTWKGYQEGDQFFYFPGDDGKIYLVDVGAGKYGDTPTNYTGHSDDVGYWLFTRSNPNKKQELKMGDKNSVIRSYFNHKKNTVVISHGWKGDGNSEINKLLKKVFLKNADINVLVFDWGSIARENYIAAKSAVVRMGETLGLFIEWMRQECKLSLAKVHLVGHSLGAHLVGNAGNLLDGNVNRITALDPAGPLWYHDKHRVSAHDARYVEVIHTNAYTCGYPLPSGHSDHYPNGGKTMPGCGAANIVCNHARSWRYLAASVERNQFRAHRCKDIAEAFGNKCVGDEGLMGNSDINKEQYGVYRVNTKPEYPYV